MIRCCSELKRTEEKQKRIVDVVEFYVENKRFPSPEEVKTLAEESGVSVYTIRDDIRRAKEGNLGDKVLSILHKRLEDAGMDVEQWRNSDLIKLYQSTRPKQIESKIDLKAEIDIKGEAITDVLNEYAGILKREALHKERVSED